MSKEKIKIWSDSFFSDHEIMVNMWHNHTRDEATSLWGHWSDYNHRYEGIVRKDGEDIGDYYSKSYETLKQAFPHLHFN